MDSEQDSGAATSLPADTNAKYSPSCVVSSFTSTIRDAAGSLGVVPPMDDPEEGV
jgi:hypothetical protein